MFYDSFSFLYVFLSIHSLLFSLFCLYAGLLSDSLDIQPNRILLVTIHHMLYPITVEVLHQVFSPHGFVEKIVTFQKSAGQHPQVFFFTFYFLCSFWVVKFAIVLCQTHTLPSISLCLLGDVILLFFYPSSFENVYFDILPVMLRSYFVSLVCEAAILFY